jgi:hypothetical protein
MTADRRAPTTHDTLEADLLRLLAAQPSAAVLDRIDRRIADRLTAAPPRALRSRPRPGRRAGLVGLLAAALVIGGATGNLQALYAFVAGPFDVPWHRGESIGLSQVVDGYRVTIDRAYADASRLALAISVVDEDERPGITQLMAMSTIVTDVDGEYGGMGASSKPDGAFAAVNVIWKEPAALPLPTGPRTFQVIVPSIRVRGDPLPPPGVDPDTWSPWKDHEGPWTFEFELDVDGGTAMTPEVSAEVDGVTVHVARVIAASGIVRVEARVEGAPDGDDWAPIGRISHDGRTAPFVVSSYEDDGTVVMFTDGGVGEGAGEWTIALDEVIGADGRLAGPWILTFESE